MQNSSPIQRLRAIHEQQPLLYAYVSFVIALVLVGLSAFFYQPRYMDSFTGFYIFLLSLPFIRLSFALLPEITPHADTDRIQGDEIIRWHWLGLAILCMLALTMINMPSNWVQAWQKTLGLMNTSPHIQMILLCVGLLTAILGFGGSLRPDRIDWKQHHSILLGIVLLGGAIRLWNLEYTIHMFVDEFFFLSGIISLNTESAQILLPVATQYTDVFSYMQLVFVNILGPSLTSLRIVTPLISMVGLVVIYALVRQLFELRVALMSAFLLAVLPVYIHLGRIGMNMVVDPIFGMMGFMFFLRGLRHQLQSDFAIAGLAFGLTHYFYEGGRIFFTLFLVCWLVWITIFSRHKLPFRLPSLKHLFVFGFCLLMVTAPFYHTLWSNDHPLTQRFDATTDSPNLLLSGRLSDFLLDNQLGHLGAPLQRYVQTPATDQFYQSDEPFILPVLVPFFLLGLGILIWRIHTVSGALFVWWVLGVAIANSIIFDRVSAPSPRYTVVYGALMIVTALGIQSLWTVLTRGFTNHWHRWIKFGFIIFLAAVGLYQVNYYFNTIVPNFHHFVFTRIPLGIRPRPAFDDMILRAVDLPTNTTVHVFSDLLFPDNIRVDVPEFYGRQTEEFDVQHIFVDSLTADYFKALSPNRNHVFTFVHAHDFIIEMIEQVFEISKIESSPFDIPDEVEMIFYFVKREVD